jgi:hypothetical protein
MMSCQKSRRYRNLSASPVPEAERYAGKWWVAVNIWDHGKFRIEMFDYVTARGAELKAVRRINELMS